MVNIRHLEILEAIAETGSFTGAAKKLFITQSAVSHAVAELEAQAGTPLFQRFPKGVTPTSSGNSLLEEARGILVACRNLDRRMPHLEENSPVRIASSITIASFLLPPILNRFRQTYPELKVSVKVASASAVLDLLHRGDADIVFWEGLTPKGDFEIVPLGSYKLRAACAPDFPVSDGPIALKDLCRYPLLLREEGSAIRDTLDHLLAASDLRAEPVWESVNSLALVKAAEAGLGVTVLPEKLLTDSVAVHRLRIMEVTEAEMENQMLALFYQNQYLSRPLQQLLDTIQEFFL